MSSKKPERIKFGKRHPRDKVRVDFNKIGDFQEYELHKFKLLPDPSTEPQDFLVTERNDGWGWGAGFSMEEKKDANRSPAKGQEDYEIPPLQGPVMVPGDADSLVKSFADRALFDSLLRIIAENDLVS